MRAWATLCVSAVAVALTFGLIRVSAPEGPWRQIEFLKGHIAMMWPYQRTFANDIENASRLMSFISECKTIVRTYQQDRMNPDFIVPRVQIVRAVGGVYMVRIYAPYIASTYFAGGKDNVLNSDRKASRTRGNYPIGLLWLTIRAYDTNVCRDGRFHSRSFTNVPKRDDERNFSISSSVPFQRRNDLDAFRSKPCALLTDKELHVEFIG